MKITNAEFLISAVSSAQYPKTGYPEIALAGRSNVGKSSFINRLIGRKNLVRTSSKPGKTRTLNYYTINDAFYFVDVPGYGYAKVSKVEREKWGKMMEEYFQQRELLEAVVLVVDGRHKPTADDVQMVEFIRHLDIPLIVVCTKMDKLTPNKQAKAFKELKKVLPEGDYPVIPFSAITGLNKDKVWDTLRPFLR